MDKLKVILFLFTMLLLICIFYNLFKNNKIENFKQINIFEEQDLLKNIEIKPHNTFDTIISPLGGKVLVQYSNDTKNDAYYKFTINIEPSKQYKISSWIAIIDNWNGQDKLYNIKMYDKNNKVRAISSNGKITNKKEMNGIKWNLVEYNFKVPKDYKNVIDIFLGYKPKNTMGKRYISGLRLKELVTDIVDFPNINNLLLYFDASIDSSYNNEGPYKKYWLDIIKNNVKLKWNKEPEWNNKGFFNMKDKKLSGPSCNNLNINTKEFSIIIIASSLGEIDTTPPMALKMCGNQNIAFAITIPNSKGNIILDIGEKTYMIKQNILTKNKNIFTFTYKNNNVKFYLDEVLVETIKDVPTIYFNDNELEINPYHKWNANLYAFLIYNKELSSNNIKILNSHFKKNIIDNEYKNETLPIEEFGENLQEDSLFTNIFNSDNIIECPNVEYSVNDGYYFDVSNTHFSKSANVTGKKYYDNKEQCMKSYNQLFSKCETPDILKNNMKPAKDCIFNGIYTNNSDEHPCQLCPELDNYNYKKHVKLSNKCKRSIISYCNNQILKDNPDENCICFNDDYKNKGRCPNYLIELHKDIIDYDAIKN